MKTSKLLLALLCAAVFSVSNAAAADLTVSLGMRETGGAGPALSDAGFSNGIEWINLDGQTLALDGTWQTFTFTPAVDPLTAFAGGTANGALEPNDQWASLEHLRILNADGITQPVTLWIDDVTVTEAAGATTEGFEGFAVGDEVMFQEPDFSGSTSGNILAGSAAGVTDGMAATGGQSYRADFQFVDNTATRWIRMTTFQSANVPNPAIRTIEPGAPAPTVSITLKGTIIPEPTTAGLMMLATMGGMVIRRRRD